MIELLEESALFSGCTPAQLEAVAVCCKRLAYQSGAIIFEAQAPAEHLYVVERGPIELHFPLTCYGVAQQVTVDRKLRGDVLGWSSLVADRRYTLSATAMGEASLLRIRSAELEALFENHDFGQVVMRRLADIIAQRFNVLQQMLIDMLQDRVVR